MPKLKENEKLINLKVNKDFHYKLKLQALKESTTMQSLIMDVMGKYIAQKNEDKDWDNFIKAHDNAPEEPPAPEDLEAIERGRLEYERGEYQDFDEVVKELDNESNSNEVG